MRTPITFRKFHSEHLRYLSPQHLQKYDHALLIGTEYMDVIDRNFAISGWVGNTCIGACGAIGIYPHRALGWAILSEEASPYMLQIVRKVRAYFDVMAFKRIEATVRADFEHGHRFARMLGLTQETPVPMRAHGPQGEDEILYALVK